MQLLRRPEQHAATRYCLTPRIWMWVPALALASCAAAGQGTTGGALSGHAVQPDSSVAIRSEETGERMAAKAGRDGSFLVPYLEPGTYTVNIGGKSEAVSVALGETTEFRPGRASATKPAEDEAVTNPDQDADGLVSVHGLASTENAAMVDGVSANQSFAGIPRGSAADPVVDPAAEDDTGTDANGLGRGRPRGAPYSFSQAAIREFRVAGPEYTALTGHAAGGIVATVSRRGGDVLHGSALYEVRSSAWAAANPLAIATSYNDGAVTSGPVKPQDLRQIFGGTLGGPMPGLARLAFFYDYDRQTRSFPAISSPGYASFYNLTPMQITLLNATRQVPVAAIHNALNYLSSLTGTLPRSAGQRIHFVRLDSRPVHGESAGMTWNRVRWSSPAGLNSAPIVARGRASFGSSNGSLDSVLLRLTSNARYGLGHELRLQYARDLQYELPQTPLPQEPAIGPNGLAPEVDIGPDGLLFGTPASLTRAAYPYERRLQAADTATWVHGHHQVQAGVDFSAVHDATSSLPNPAGTFSYDSGLTNGHAGGLVDWITDYTFGVNSYPNGGCPSIAAANHTFCFRSFTQSFGPQTVAFDTQEWAGFVQETWRLRPGWSVGAGLRYEYQLLPVPQQPNPALDAAFGATGATGVFPEDRNNFGPRLGLALEPFGSGRMTLRLGYGAFYGRLPGATIAAALTDTALPVSNTHIRFTPTATVACPQVANQGFGYVCTYDSAPPSAVSATSSARVFDRHFRLPMVQQASLTLERALPRRTLLTAGYVVNLDRQLPSSTDINIAPSPAYRLFRLEGGTGAPGVRDGETFAIPVYTTRVNTSYGPVTDIRSNVNASYNALLVTAQTHPTRGLGLRAAYTWSKAIDEGQMAGAIPRTNGQFEPFDNRYDKGLSALNYPQALVAHGTWEPMVHGGEAWLRGAANGWLLAPIFTLRSGRPYSLNIFGGNTLAGGRESINGSGGATYLPTVGRNTLRLPLAVNLDLRLSRDVPLPRLGGDRVHLRAYAEGFNVLNHLNVSSVSQRAYLPCDATSPSPPCPLPPVPVAGVPAATMLVFQNAANVAVEGLNTQPFGTPTASGSSVYREREIQLGLRLDF
jgi:hypothetical protein